jgi:hypothetical protein
MYLMHNRWGTDENVARFADCPSVHIETNRPSGLQICDSDADVLAGQTVVTPVRGRET